MRALLALAALSAAATSPTPAIAVDPDQNAFVGIPDLSVQSGVVVGRHDRNFRRHRGADGSVLIYERDYQGDSAWKSDSFNDWWHDRPERSYPRWMANNQGCERMWWGGGAWRC